MTKYFNNYEDAKAYAEKHHLIECEYGDTSYYLGKKPISYVAYNKSGDRRDEWLVECYYTWEEREKNHLVPKPIDREWITRLFGV